jgi:hypothetical protein
MISQYFIESLPFSSLDEFPIPHNPSVSFSGLNDRRAQDPILPGRTTFKVPAGYPEDLYWKGQPPKEECAPGASCCSLASNPHTRRADI